MAASLLTLALAGSAAAAVPVGLDAAVLGPAGVAPIELVDAPDLVVRLRPSDGGVLLIDTASGDPLPDGSLSASTTLEWAPGGVQRWVRSDAAGRVARVTWGSGRRMVIERDAQGRVVEILGPGTQRQRLSYTDGVVVEDTLGAMWSMTSADERVWSVRDGAGRQVRVTVDPEQGTITGWEDPRGLSSVVSQRDLVTELVGPGGGTWRVGREARGGFLEQPDGLRWSWKTDADGRLLRLRDPLGTEGTWSYDSEGRVLAAEHAGRRQSVERDSDGRVTAWSAATGATVRLRWDGGGVGQVLDASGTAVVLERDAEGRVEAVLSRSGGRWELGRDLDGAIDRVTDPAGRELEAVRDGAGRVVRVSFQGRELRLERDSAGRVVGVRDPRGSRTGLARDATGRVREVRTAAGSLHIERDAAGEIVGVKHGGSQVYVRRDSQGRPIAAGPVSWVWDLVGAVDRLVSPGVELVFGRDVAGRLRSVRAGEDEVQVVRDPHGDPVLWTGGDADVRVERDSAGRIVLEDVGGRVVRGVRGVRGDLDRVDSARGAWRWSRGADGSVLRIEGPDGVGVGTDRDAAGRVTLTRLPRGGLLRRIFEDGMVAEQLEDGGGEVVTRSAWSPDIHGLVAWVQVDDQPRTVWQTDPAGRLVAVEAGDDTTWSFGTDVDHGPGGWVRAKDLLGRTTELLVGDQWPAWGAMGGAWAYARTETGALAQVAGSEGAFEVVHDGFGHLVSVASPQARWTVQWDALGRPHAVQRPSGTLEVTWAPGQVAGTPLATGEAAWMDTRAGAVAWSRASESGPASGAGAVWLPGGTGAWVEDALGLLPVRWGEGTGVSDSGALDPLGGRGGLMMFTGGPELFTGGALDPAGNERTDGTLDWPWCVDDGAPRVVRTVWDPAGWQPETRWGDPVAIADALGLVDVPDATQGASTAPAFAWLPQSLDARPQPVGPPMGHLDITDELEPIVARVFAHLAEGGGPIDWSVVAGELVSPDELGTLPPGLRIPGLHGGTARPLDLGRGPTAKKVVASWDGLL